MSKQHETISSLQSDDSVVMFVAEIDSIFEFIRVSSNVTQLLQMQSMELLNKNINCIINYVYA